MKRAYHVAYNARNVDRLREQRRLYVETHREEEATRWQAWRLANPDRRRAIERRARSRFAAAHPEKALDKNSRRRALVLGATVERVERLEVYRRDRGRCGICGRFVAKARFDIDHVRPLAKGGEHSYANVQVSHPVCNNRKRAAYVEAVPA